jgi:hypothetical protein
MTTTNIAAANQALRGIIREIIANAWADIEPEVLAAQSAGAPWGDAGVTAMRKWDHVALRALIGDDQLARSIANSCDRIAQAVHDRRGEVERTKRVQYRVFPTLRAAVSAGWLEAEWGGWLDSPADPSNFVEGWIAVDLDGDNS